MCLLQFDLIVFSEKELSVVNISYSLFHFPCCYRSNNKIHALNVQEIRNSNSISRYASKDTAVFKFQVTSGKLLNVET